MPEDRREDRDALIDALNERTKALEAANERMQEEIIQRKITELEVRELNEALEQRVIDRTAELNASLDELKRTQAQLIESEKMAALANLVAGVAHEINTPVGVGVTAASLLDEKTKAFAEAYRDGKMKRSDLEKYIELTGESAAMLLSNLRRAADLVQSFKQVAVDQSSQGRRTFNLKEYLDEILASLRPALKKGNHTVRVNCPAEIALDSFPGALSQVLTNLAMNSVIHGFESKDAGVIAIEATEDDGHVNLCYSDDGKGMTPEELAHLYEPFFTTKRSRGGSGLGMHIVYNLVTQTLGGQIHCSSEPGEGTSFVLRLPVKRESR